MEYKDYYAVLGVDKKATSDEIKQAYRRLARKYHPDVSKEANAEEHFKNVQEAYEVLKDSEKRTAYDQLGNQWQAGQDFRPPPDWQSHTQFYNEEEGSNFSDFFSHLFGGRGRRSGFTQEDFGDFSERGRDQQAKIHLTLEEAFHGTSKTFQLQIPEMDAHGQMHRGVRTVKVNIPAGTISGQQLRLAKQGSPGVGKNAPAGDLYLEIELDSHPFFSLQGHDVYITLPLTPWEAALGAEIKIPTLGGPVGLKVAPGTTAGQKLRLKHRGMPNKPHAGDQYAIVRVDVPPAHNEEQRQAYEKMAKVLPFNPRQTWTL